jgi:CheY-like chemotaxis protein
MVDDEPDVEMLFRQQFRRDLRSGRFVMEFAQSAPAALQCISDARNTSLILILSDINMPGMTGLELLPKAKAARPDVPVIMITAYGDAETKRRALEGGAEALLTKPIDFGLRNEIDSASRAATTRVPDARRTRLWGRGRREFISLMGGGAAAAWASRPGSAKILSQLHEQLTAALETNLTYVRDGLRDAGYEEGRNISIKYLLADGVTIAFRPLVSKNSLPPGRYNRHRGNAGGTGGEKKRQPLLVVRSVGDPVGTGLVESGHPGASRRTEFVAPDLQGQAAQLLREVAPCSARRDV